MMRGIIFHIPEATAITPAEGHAFVDQWWVIHPEKGLLFYCTRRRPFDLEAGEQDEPSPQCNSNENVARHIQHRIYPDCDVKFLLIVFISHAIKEMHRWRKLAHEEKKAVVS